MIVMRGDDGLHDWDFPHILGHQRAGILPGGGQRGLAVRTALRMMMPHLGDMLGVGGGAFVPLMPNELTAARRRPPLVDSGHGTAAEGMRAGMASSSSAGLGTARWRWGGITP